MPSLLRASIVTCLLPLSVAAAVADTPQVQNAQLDALLTARQFERQPQNQSADWLYAMTVSQAGQKAWIIQKAASGDTAKRAFKVRNTLFTFAAREVLRWQDRYMGEQASGNRFEGRYVYATFIAGLYLRYAGDYWAAREYLGEAAMQIGALKSGQRMPRYAQTKLDTAIDRELSGVEAIVRRYGSTPPYDRIAHFGMSTDGMLQRSGAAADFVYAQANDDPPLLAAAAPSLVTNAPR